jgi:hypothetical protein
VTVVRSSYVDPGLAAKQQAGAGQFPTAAAGFRIALGHARPVVALVEREEGALLLESTENAKPSRSVSERQNGCSAIAALTGRTLCPSALH